MGEWVGCYTCPAPLNEHVSLLWCVCRGGRYLISSCLHLSECFCKRTDRCISNHPYTSGITPTCLARSEIWV